MTARSLLMLRAMNQRAWWTGVLLGSFLAACGGQALPETGGSAGGDVSAASSAASSGTGGGPSTGAGAGGASAVACVPGQSVRCACTTGDTGAQVCTSDGTYGSCVCEANVSPPPPVIDAGLAEGPDARQVSPVDCPCTRRPGPGTSIRCPVGVGQATTMTIGPEGGKIFLDGQQRRATGVPFSVEVPPTALDTATPITVMETTIPPPSDFIDYSPIYYLQPVNVMTTIPMPITIGWSNKDGTVGGDLAVYAGPDGTGPFVRVPDSYLNAGFMQASIKQFGAFFVGYPRRPDQAVCP
jgi:hypothetical protein